MFRKILFLSTLAVVAPSWGKQVSRKTASNKVAQKSKKAKMSSKDVAATVMVYDEHTSFEDLIENREKLSRRPAGFNIKARVIGIRRDIGLSNESDDASQRDVILNAGSNAGLTKGMVLGVKRKIPILDPYRENVQRLLELEFAKLKVVHVQGELSIARISSVDDIAEGLSIGLRSVVIGDYVGTN